MRAIAFAILIAIPVAASAQPAPVLSTQSAQAIIAGCTAHAAGKGNAQAIVVVDLGGRVIASLRMDRVTFGKMDFAEAKAVAAAAWGFDTAGQADGAKEFPGFADAPYVETVPGGLPIWSADGKARVGAVGVSGAAPEDDAGCAEAGITAAGLRTTRS